MMNLNKVILAMVVLVLFGPTGSASDIWFNSPELRSAGADLREFLGLKGEKLPQEKVAPPDAKFQPGDWVVADLSKDRNGSLAALLGTDDRASLESGNPESFVAQNSNGVYYLVGSGQRGAIYASARLQSAWEGSGENPLATAGATLRGTPTFTIRIGGAGGPNEVSDMSQPFPDDYDWDDYARDLAHYGVNQTAGVIGGEIVPDAALSPWGIRKILFVSANPFLENQLRSWRSSNRDDLKPLYNSRSPEAALEWGPCIGSEFGKKAYREWLTELSERHRTASSLVFYFSDWGGAPGQECSPGTSLPERVLAFLKEIDSIARTIGPDLKVYASTRGFSADDLRKIVTESPPRVGIYFEEPSRSLLDDPTAGYDPSLATTELDPVFEEILRNTLESKPKDTIAAVAAGDSDWLVSPAIGLPLPSTAHRKLQMVAGLGAQNVALAMGGLHPWVYSPASEVIKEIFWNREEPYEELAARIAARDFGHLASNVQAAWSSFEVAIKTIPSISRSQRLHDFVGSANDSIAGPIGIRDLETHPWSTAIRDSAPFLLETLPAAVDLWEQGVSELQAAQGLVGENTYEMAKRLRDTLFWSTFYLRAIESQNHVIRSLNLLACAKDGADPTKDPWRQAFLPIYHDEAETAQGWKDLLETAPYSRIRIEKEVTTPSAISRKLDQKQSALANLMGE